MIFFQKLISIIVVLLSLLAWSGLKAQGRAESASLTKNDTSHEYRNQRIMSVHNILQMRMDILKQIARPKKENHHCNTTNAYIIVTEYWYGQLGNQMISFIQTLWVANKINATLVLPYWMKEMLQVFDIHRLHEHYCFTYSETQPKGATIHEITSEESFFLQKLFKMDTFMDLLPPMSDDVIKEVALHFVRVIAALWSEPHHAVLNAVDHIIHHHLDSNFRYTSVHKRGLDGSCHKILGYVTKPSDFSIKELPMDNEEWVGNLLNNHPLCWQSVNFIRSTQSLHSRNGSKVFVAWDGKGDVGEYTNAGMVFSNDVLRGNPKFTKVLEMKFNTHPHETHAMQYVDMFVAMHGDLFIMNPRSTFSWQIFVVRACLALESVPIMRPPQDFYLQKYPEELKANDREPWVSWTTILDVLHNDT